VRFWHLADISGRLDHVRSGAKRPSAAMQLQQILTDFYPALREPYVASPAYQQSKAEFSTDPEAQVVSHNRA
ncbi:MAG: hypothetical protein ACRD3W_10120, partial [Terriglobales bacterium]